MSDECNLTRLAYDKHGTPYTIYQELNEFYGMPIPDGYVAKYINDGMFPPGLQLRKINNER